MRNEATATDMPQTTQNQAKARIKARSSLRTCARRGCHDAISPDGAIARGAGRVGDEAVQVKDTLQAGPLRRDFHHACAWRVRDGLRAQEARVRLCLAHRRRAPRPADRSYGGISYRIGYLRSDTHTRCLPGL